MKQLTVLVITYDYGKTASGIVTRRVCEALRKSGVRLFIITSLSSINDIDDDLICVPNILRYDSIIYRLYTHFISPIFQVDAYENVIWQRRAYRRAEKIVRLQNIDFVYARSSPFDALEVGYRIRRKYNVPLLLHFTDPYPAPFEYLPDARLRKDRTVKACRWITGSDLVSFGNSKMLEYERNLIHEDIFNKCFISPDPVSRSTVLCSYQRNRNDNSIKLLYLGNIYPPRNPSHLIEAMRDIYQCGINISLDIYCDRTKNMINEPFVQYHSKTANVEAIMLESDILVDIDGDDSIPVFISSKLKEYLSIPRPILSISPHNSPSSELLYGQNTVVCVENRIDAISNALQLLINSSFKYSDFLERNCIIEEYSSIKISDNIIKSMKKYVNRLAD